MAIPDYQALMLPVLRLAATGVTRVPDAAAAIADQLGLTEPEREEMLPSGRQRVLHNRIHWAKFYMAKAGLIGLTRALAKEVGPSGVTVNCVCPGVIQTDMLGDFTGRDLAALAEETPLGRLGTPQEVAAAILWLCQGDAAFVTGQVIGVGGGFGA